MPTSQTNSDEPAPVAPKAGGAAGGKGAGCVNAPLTPWLMALGLAAAASLAVGPIREAFGAAPSTSVLALFLGMVVGALPGMRARFGAAAKQMSKQAIPVAIVLIGFSLELGLLVSSGHVWSSLVLVAFAMLVAFGAAMLFGKLFGLDPRTSLLLGAGTAVCGNSAIMAVAPAVDADDENLGLCIGVINLLGVVMLLALPPLAMAAGIDGTRGGSLAGLTVHAVPQAIATGEAFGEDALPFATLFKMLRVTMLVPTVVILTLVLSRVRKEEHLDSTARPTGAKSSPVPVFVILFVVAAGIRATGILDADFSVAGTSHPAWDWLNRVGKFVLAGALAAIGFGLNLPTLVRVGPRVLGAATLAVAAMVGLLMPMVLWLL